MTPSILKEIAYEQLHSRPTGQSVEELAACARICTLFHDAAVICGLTEEGFGSPSTWRARGAELFDALCEAEKKSSDPAVRGRALHALYTLSDGVLSPGDGSFRTRCDLVAGRLFRAFSLRPDMNEAERIALLVCQADCLYPDFDSAFERSLREELFRWAGELEAEEVWPGIAAGQAAGRLRLYSLNANLLLDDRFDALYLRVRNRILREVHAEDIAGNIAAYELSTVYALPGQPADADSTACMAARLHGLGNRLPKGAERLQCTACVVHWLTERLYESVQSGFFARTA